MWNSGKKTKFGRRLHQALQEARATLQLARAPVHAALLGTTSIVEEVKLRVVACPDCL